MVLTRLSAMLVVAAVAAVTALLTVPPWMVVDSDDPQGRHTALGHHPRWQPPSRQLAEAALSDAGKRPRVGARPALQIRTNSVRLALELTGTAASAAALRFLLVRRR